MDIDPRRHSQKSSSLSVDFNSQSLLDALPDAMLVVDHAGRIVIANVHAEELFGYTYEQLIDKSVEELVPPRLCGEHPNHREHFFDDARVRPMGVGLELFALRKDGTEVPVDISLSPIAIESETFVVAVVRDETERRRTEELKKSEAVRLEGEGRFRSIANSAPVLIWVSGPDRERTYFNQTWLEFTGRSMEAELGNGWADGVHPEDLQGCLNTYTYSFDRREKFRMEYRLRRHGGEYRWILDDGVPRFNKDRSFAGYIGIGIDVTDRVRTEEALRQTNRELSEARRLAGVGSWHWDIQNDIAIWSEELYRIAGRDPMLPAPNYKECPGLLSAESWERLQRAADATLRDGRSYELDLEMIRPDGTTRWVTARGEAVSDTTGRIVRLRGTTQDITERKLAQEKLQEYERAVEGLEEMIVVVDREYRYRIANNKFLKMRNMTKEQVVGHLAHEVLNKGVFEAGVKEKLDECFQGKVVRYEMKYTYPELGERDVLVSYFPIEGATGVDRVACIVQDITQRKLAEEALSMVSQKLIEAQEEERTRIARELHDDVGQRLALLAALLDSLKEGRPVSAAELESQIGDLRKQVGDLANDVQAISHQLHSPRLEYLGLAAAAGSVCRELSDRQGVEIDFHSENIPKELPKEISLCLFRVLQESLQNAIKHSGSRQFQVSLTGGVNEIELKVHDSGIGFEPEEAIKGQGLGLTSMKERLRAVDGEFSIDSQLQRGTTIRARVPFSPKSNSMTAVG
jgi:PAS domain S-box-containing protein